MLPAMGPLTELLNRASSQLAAAERPSARRIARLGAETQQDYSLSPSEGA